MCIRNRYLESFALSGRSDASTILSRYDDCVTTVSSYIVDAKALTMNESSATMNACIENCLNCYKTCLGMATNHCLNAGGKHVEPAHFRLMLACAEICRVSAHFMLLGSKHHKHTCRECAEICAECAASCESVGDMDECVAACKTCAESCEAMAA